MPSERDRVPSRRRILAACVGGLAVGVSGCQQLPDGDTTTETTAGRDTTTETTAGSETATETTAGSEPSTGTASATESTTERPLTPACPECELLETESHDGDGVGNVLPPRSDEQSAAIAVLAGDWRETVEESELNDDARGFLEATDFDARTVVAVQYTEPGYPQTQRLTRYARDGAELHLALTAAEMGPLNAENEELVLIRTTDGTDERPTHATATVRIGDAFELTISTRN